MTQEPKTTVLDQAVDEVLAAEKRNGQTQDDGAPPPPIDPPVNDHREDKPDEQRTVLSPPEVAYWKQVQEQAKEADNQIRQAQIMEQQAIDLRQQAMMKMGAYDSFLQFTSKFHKFDSEQERLDPEGRIVKIEQTPR